MKQTESNKQQIPAAPYICDECMRHRAERHAHSDVIIVYCSHSLSGGAWSKQRGLWTVWGPVSAEAFEQARSGAVQDFSEKLKSVMKQGSQVKH